MAVGDPKFSIEVVRQDRVSTDKPGGLSVIDVLSQNTIVDEDGNARYVVEVFRSEPLPIDTTRKAKLIERVMPGGSLANVGVGPVLPEHPYEGQVWIKI